MYSYLICYPLDDLDFLIKILEIYLTPSGHDLFVEFYKDTHLKLTIFSAGLGSLIKSEVAFILLNPNNPLFLSRSGDGNLKNIKNTD
jgi:hypothetical protein